MSNTTKNSRISQLDSVEKVRRELRNIYRLMRLGELENDDGRALAYILGQVRSCIESNIEDRVRALEDRAGGRMDVQRGSHLRVV